MKEKLLERFIPLVDFIAAIVGPHCEVVLHDVTNVESSIIAIRNGHISGRKVGGPLTDLGLKFLKEKLYQTQDAMVNYPARTKDGKPLRSSTFFIKDDNGELVGMLCVNVDLSTALQARKFIDDFIMNIDTDKQAQKINLRSEFLEVTNPSLEDLMSSLIEETIKQFNVPPERLSQEEKIEIVQKLNDKGFFLLKGAVTELAKYLKTSESTIYRYLNNYKKRDEK
ncbi:helix-turn-helix transcriptional regulator [Carboxydothermus hydrogenoformans]|uniref:Putative PAC domain protein n=1 Tax=Carboxydothermus hydrogenoformans (strain ATCC BAA-161 / DSM 6008 / Z-2901) TaxID=246194 RepID=Q3A9C9_CARHZ|nr:PAS domain-containing protein [Carboxydothermus hydrogenoformans]ABB15973.1 putative PAC domain protein [Carboxydothermus hydrogenoformans Z-2901]